ncbi:FtsZ-interacting cell division protein ZipA [Kibdelosporangium phytohabitans]|nr:FtsZ-interacting cell division protein ZipA [Kibdelosporangium phytohabitans]
MTPLDSGFPGTCRSMASNPAASRKVTASPILETAAAVHNSAKPNRPETLVRKRSHRRTKSPQQMTASARGKRAPPQTGQPRRHARKHRATATACRPAQSERLTPAQHRPAAHAQRTEPPRSGKRANQPQRQTQNQPERQARKRREGLRGCSCPKKPRIQSTRHKHRTQSSCPEVIPPARERLVPCKNRTIAKTGAHRTASTRVTSVLHNRSATFSCGVSKPQPSTRSVSAPKKGSSTPDQ